MRAYHRLERPWVSTGSGKGRGEERSGAGDGGAEERAGVGGDC